MKIHPAAENDLAQVVQLFTESVHGIASSSYGQEQLAAWAPRPPDMKQWQSRLSGLTTLLADDGSNLAGFVSFSTSGHIEHLFTSPEFSRQGIATQLFAAARDALRERSIDRLTTAASLEARPFFERQGFHVSKEETVQRNGVSFKRFVMESYLSPRARRNP